MALEDLHARVSTDHCLLLPQDAPPLDLATVLNASAASGYVEEVEGGWRLTAQGFDALTGPIANEPPPMEGAQLERAEQANAKLAEEEAELEQAAKQKRATELKEAYEEVEAEIA